MIHNKFVQGSMFNLFVIIFISFVIIRSNWIYRTRWVSDVHNTTRGNNFNDVLISFPFISSSTIFCISRRRRYITTPHDITISINDLVIPQVINPEVRGFNNGVIRIQCQILGRFYFHNYSRTCSPIH